MIDRKKWPCACYLLDLYPCEVRELKFIFAFSTDFRIEKEKEKFDNNNNYTFVPIQRFDRVKV